MADVLELLIAERDRLDQAIAVLEGPRRRGRPPVSAEKANNPLTTTPKKAAQRGRKPMSAEARQRLSEKLKKYWAKRKATSVGVPKKAGEKKHKGMSAEARKRRSEGMKKWWAAHRKAAKKAAKKSS